MKIMKECKKIAYNEEMNIQTRECMQTALLLLMDEKPIDKISITELVNKAGVSRTSYYRNYNSKKEILTEVCSMIVDEIRDSVLDPSYIKNPRVWFVKLCKKMREKSASIRLLLNAHVAFEEVIGSSSILEKIVPSEKKEVHYCYLALEGGLFNLLLNWYRDGMNIEPASMADMCIELFGGMIGKIHQEWKSTGLIA